MHPNSALSVLYVLTECIHTEGYLTAYKVDPHTGSMRELGRVTLTGRSSCYISFDKYAHHAIITNYWDGLINVVELSPAGMPLRVVQEHQQTRRTTWRQVENRAVSAGLRGGRTFVLCGQLPAAAGLQKVLGPAQALSTACSSWQDVFPWHPQHSRCSGTCRQLPTVSD
jgi:6-phosphogluconolactonase (cycloisomerase 2 family)